MNNNDELERMLGRDLHDQVDGMSGVPFGFGDVKGRAGKIRRNRRIAAGVGVAAALAVIVPTAITAGGMLQSTSEIQPAQPSPAPGPVEVARTTLTLDGLERGDAPGVEYFTPDGVVLPGEGLQELDQRYQALVPSEAQGGYVAVGPDGQEIQYLSEDLESQGGAAKNMSFVTTTERDHYAFVEVEAGAQTLVSQSVSEPDDGMVWDLPAQGVAEVVGYLGEDRLVVEVIDQTDGTAEVLVAEPDGSLAELRGYVGAQATDQAEGLVALQAGPRRGGCFAVVDPGSPDRPLWTSCTDKPGAFSPDGRHVMSTPVDGDGFGLRTINVHDVATGALVTSFTQASNTAIDLLHPTWETSETIVSVAYEGETVTMVRLALDGTLTEVADRSTGPAFDLTYYLGQDRRTL